MNGKCKDNTMNIRTLSAILIMVSSLSYSIFSLTFGSINYVLLPGLPLLLIALVTWKENIPKAKYPE